jgi:hypothetical protein
MQDLYPTAAVAFVSAKPGTPRGIRIAGLAGFAIGYRIHDGLFGLSDRNRLRGPMGAQ